VLILFLRLNNSQQKERPSVGKELSHMPTPIAAVVVILIIACLLYVGGFLYLVILALLLLAGKHLSVQSKLAGRWRIDRHIFIAHLIIIGLPVFIALIFPFFTKTIGNIITVFLLFGGACCYSFCMSLKKED
jgi:hypothetical protein